jgi:hypothetical protein
MNRSKLAGGCVDVCVPSGSCVASISVGRDSAEPEATSLERGVFVDVAVDVSVSGTVGHIEPAWDAAFLTLVVVVVVVRMPCPSTVLVLVLSAPSTAVAPVPVSGASDADATPIAAPNAPIISAMNASRTAVAPGACPDPRSCS